MYMRNFRCDEFHLRFLVFSIYIKAPLSSSICTFQRETLKKSTLRHLPGSVAGEERREEGTVSDKMTGHAKDQSSSFGRLCESRFFFFIPSSYRREHGTRARWSVSPSVSGQVRFNRSWQKERKEREREGGGREWVKPWGERPDLLLIGSAMRQVGPSSRPGPVSRVESGPPDTRYASLINVIIKNAAIRPRWISESHTPMARWRKRQIGDRFWRATRTGRPSFWRPTPFFAAAWRESDVGRFVTNGRAFIGG